MGTDVPVLLASLVSIVKWTVMNVWLGLARMEPTAL